MKNITEWSVGFDLEYNNITSNKAPGLNEYEKSCFLSQAQEIVMLQLYNGSARESFEGSEELTKYLSSLVRQAIISATESSLPHIIEGSYIFKLPEDLLFRTYEDCKLTDGVTTVLNVSVVPVTQDDFWRIFRDPFKTANRRRVLRLTYASNSVDNGALLENEYSELVSSYPIQEYKVRYIEKPSPIILTDLTGTGLSVDGEVLPKTCMLPEILHQTILTEAVRLAKSVWSSNN